MIDNGLFTWYFCLDNFCVPGTHLHLKLCVPERYFQCCTRKFCVNANTVMIISGRQNLLIDILFPIRVDIMLYLTQYQPEAFRKMINSMGLGDMAKFLKD